MVSDFVTSPCDQLSISSGEASFSRIDLKSATFNDIGVLCGYELREVIYIVVPFGRNASFKLNCQAERFQFIN